ncbi:MAG: oligosaccharide flippase family protein [Ignavibacteriales bacterium]|nr:oligosaccharide flippase family protein [Ignavibacteriales bacterium]
MKENNINIHEGSWLRSVVKHGKWYLVSSIITKGIGIFLIPFYTSYLSEAEYGILNGLLAAARFVPIIISLGLDAAFARFFHDKKHSPEKLKELFSTIFWFVTVFGTVIITIILLTSELWLENLLEVPVWPYAFLTFIPAIFFQIGQLGIVFLRQSLLAKQTSVLEVVSTAINILSMLFFVIVFSLKIEAILLGKFAGYIFLFIFYTIYFVRKNILGFVFNKKLLIACMLFSLPLIPGTAFSWIQALSDRFVIGASQTNEILGLYTFAANLAMILYILSDAITQVIGPITLSGLIFDKERAKKKIADFSLFIFALMLFANLILFLFSKELISIMTFFSKKESQNFYLESILAIPLLSFMYVLSAQYRIFMNVIQYHKKMWILSSGIIIAGIVNLSLNIILIPEYGYFVAVITSVLAILIYTLWIFYWSQHLEHVNIEYKKYFKIFIVVIICISGIYYFKVLIEISIINIFLKSIIIFCIGLFFIYIYKLEKLKEVINIIKPKK